MKNDKKIISLAVADKSNRGWKWRKIGGIDSFRVTYYHKTTPDRYFEENNILYVRQVCQKYLNKLLYSSLKISGGAYVLALTLNKGEMNNDFQTLYTAFDKKRFSTWNSQKKYMILMEQYIKSRGMACAIIEDDKPNWVDFRHLPISKSTIQSYWSRYKELFISIDRVLYFLTPQSIIVENLYWKCVQIAGSDYKLAKETAIGDLKKQQMHVAAFRRLGYKQEKSVAYYVKVFGKFLNKNPQLFDEKVAV